TEGAGLRPTPFRRPGSARRSGRAAVGSGSPGAVPRRAVPRPMTHFGRQHRALVEVPANGLGEVAATARAEVRTAAEKIDRQLAQAEILGAGHAPSDHVIHAVVEEEGALIAGQRLGPLAVHVGQATADRDDAVPRQDRLGALRGAYLALFHRHPPASRDDPSSLVALSARTLSRLGMGANPVGQVPP